MKRIVIQVQDKFHKSCSVLHTHFSETIKVVETLLWTAYVETLSYYIGHTYVVGTH